MRWTGTPPTGCGLAPQFARAWAARRNEPAGPRRRGGVYRNLSTPEGRAFWALSPRAAEVESWPAWRRAGVTAPYDIPDRDMPKSYCEVL